MKHTYVCCTDLEDEDYLEYIQEVSVASAGLGVGLSVAFGLVAFVSMLFMCCRCKRLHRADLAIAQAEGDNDGAFACKNVITSHGVYYTHARHRLGVDRQCRVEQALQMQTLIFIPVMTPNRDNGGVFYVHNTYEVHRITAYSRYRVEEGGQRACRIDSDGENDGVLSV